MPTMWTNWDPTTAVRGDNGSVSGVLGSVLAGVIVNVSYSGQVDAPLGNPPNPPTGRTENSVFDGTSNIWAPDTSFIGGTVTTSPSIVGDDIRLNGIGQTVPNKIIFSPPVTNPVFAIWSLGDPGPPAGTTGPASFTFINATPIIEAGGPNSKWGGSSITVSGNTVSGSEGNGVVQFTGTFTSISWTNTSEHFYAFTVGFNPPPPPSLRQRLQRLLWRPASESGRLRQGTGGPERAAAC